MGNVLSECQRISIDQCEVCTGVLHPSRGNLQGTAANGTGSAANAQRRAAAGGGRQDAASVNLADMSDAEVMAHALRMSRLQHEQEVGNLTPARVREIEEEERAALQLERARQEEESRERQRLREEQAAEYEESLRVDREREAEKARKLREEEDERRAVEEKVQEEARVEDARKAAVLAKIADARSLLEPEPSHDEASASSVVKIALMLPDGRRLKRSFASTATVSQIYYFVDVEGGEEIAGEQYRLVQRMPKKVYEDRDATFETEGLTGQCTLLIELIDP